MPATSRLPCSLKHQMTHLPSAMIVLDMSQPLTSSRPYTQTFKAHGIKDMSFHSPF